MGDGKTPIGTLRPLSAFGIKPNPGTTMPYIDVKPTTYACDEDCEYYNKIIDTAETKHECKGEEMYSYLGVISSKCEEITRLTNDMITHSISELNALRMLPEQTDLTELVSEVVKENAAGAKVSFEQPMFPAVVLADKGRLKQLFGNLLGNAEKYAGTNVDIAIKKKEGSFLVTVRDYGKGIPDEDMPFIFGKFYRGGNTEGKSGSGLGLYIVKYIAQQSGGDVTLENKDPGLEVTVTIPEDENSR